MTLEEEKARELIAKMWVTPSMTFNDVKQCALIAINEMLEYTKEEVFPMGNVMPKYHYDPYLEEVKEELEKL